MTTRLTVLVAEKGKPMTETAAMGAIQSRLLSLKILGDAVYLAAQSIDGVAIKVKVV